MLELPVVDLRDVDAAAQLDRACTGVGFVYVVGHGVDEALGERLEREARAFFAKPDADKAAIAMARGGKAWRGWFPLGGELTSGVPDRKEGIYFGAEEPPGDVPLHGPNQFPDDPPRLRGAVLDWLGAMTELGRRLCRLLAVSPDLVADPTVLFRIFRYPPVPAGDDGWGVAEHTDYGLLTILRQDALGGLEVRAVDGSWIAAPPLPGSFVVNVGDMLERLTGGRWRSTPHRVRNTSGGDRLSFPFFFDPSWDAAIPDVPGAPVERWDGQDLYAVRGSYGEYLLAKVAKVFPDLAGEQLPSDP